MQDVSPSRSAIRFDNFEADLRAGELRKEGCKVKLQEQPFQILQILLEHSGELVTREELQRRIWPADTFVDFDHGLYNAIKRLREALGDTAGAPRFIETVPKRGYRFIGTINGNGHAAMDATQEPSVAAAPEVAIAPAKEPALEPAAAMPTAALASPKLHWSLILLSVVGSIAALALLLAVTRGGVTNNLRRWLSGGAAVPAIHSLAVLPLQNLSGDPSQEYFSDAMTDELITELSSISALKVISRTSVMRYKKSDKSLPDIAHELHVDGIIEGSVVRNGSDVRVTTQLIYAPEDKNVWARSFQREFQDSLTLQSEVASDIVVAVRAQVDPAEQARLQAARPANPKALEDYLQGNYHFNRYGYGYGIEEADTALEYFRHAIAEDPTFARAYASMADVYAVEGTLVPHGQMVQLIKTAAEKALALDPNLPEAHLSLADVKSSNGDWQGAELEFKRAIELDPNSASAHEAFGSYLVSMGQMERGLDEQERAQELDPAEWHVEGGLYEARRYDEAISLFTKHLDSTPTDGRAHFWLSESYAQKGMDEEAIHHLRSAAVLFGLEEIAESMDRAYKVHGYKGSMRELAKGTEQLYARHQFTPQWIARFYLRAGDKEQALKWLQKEYEERGSGLINLNVDPVWDPLRSDTRFKDLVRRVGLPTPNAAVLNIN